MNRKVLRNLAMALLVGVTLAGCVKEYTITVVSNNDAWGTVTGTGTYAFGEEVTITATPATGYYFQRWDDGVNTNPRIVTVEGTKIYTAVFASNSGDNPPPGTTVSGTINGHDYVDLGLPSGLKWATCNVGATSPEGYGDYFAWGEINTRANYIRDDLTPDLTDTDISGNPIYDVACAKWGSTWRMPTSTEVAELARNCTWAKVEENGVIGVRAVGPNGNSIFIPCSGYYTGVTLKGVGSWGHLNWCSTPNTNASLAYSLFINSGYIGSCNYTYREYGLTIRPVSN